MAIRIYLMPMVQAPVDTPLVRQRPNVTEFWIPKYLQTSERHPDVTVFMFGREPVCLYVANLSQTEHDLLVANSDVRAFPSNIDAVVTDAARVQIVNALEGLNIPAHWVANGDSFRIVFRRLVGISCLLSNINGEQGHGLRFLQSRLDSSVSAIPAAARSAIQNAAVALGLSTAGITGVTTLRAALANIGAQFDSRAVQACGVSL